MKIIIKDNFDRDNVSDVLVCENINKEFGEKIVNLLNIKESDNSPYFFKLVENDYKLYEWKP